MAVSHSRTIRTRRINLRATDRQEKLIRTGAETTGLSVTNFILDSACLQAERVLADKREFIASPKQWKAFVEALDRPAQIKPELARLFSETGILERESRKWRAVLPTKIDSLFLSLKSWRRIMTLHRLTAEKRHSMIGSADSPSQTNRMTRLAPTSFIGPVRLSAITLSPQAQSAVKSRRRVSQKDSQSIRLASFCLSRVMIAADAIGARAMLVHAIDEDAVAFYRKFGFEPSPLDPKQLMLLVKDLRATLQSVGLG